MKSISETRRENLIEIIHRDFGGRQVGLASAMGIQANLISRWMASPNNKNFKIIGDVSARKIETAARRPAFWLDSDHAMAMAAGVEPVDVNTEIGQIAAKNLADWMQANRDLKTQAAVAEKAQIGQSTINRLLKCEASISINNLASIAGVFGRRAYELLIPPHDDSIIQYDHSRFAALPAEEKAKITSFIDFIMSQNHAK